MDNLNRRGFLRTAGAVAAGLAIGACSGNGGGDGGGAPRKLTWWDYKDPIIDLAKQMHKKWGKLPVEVQFIENTKIGQALQLAKQSDQMPDVFTPHDLQLPLPGLIEAGWYQPVQWDEEFLAGLPENALFEGIHTHGGKPYTFPLMSPHYFFDQTWFNTEMLERAGIDSGDPPKTYDDFRAACRKVQQEAGDGVSGVIHHLKQVPRLRNDIDELAMSGGFQGRAGELFRTGEFAYHDDAYVNAIEFLMGLKQDGVLSAASSSVNAAQARGRWAAGSAAFYLDGPWCAGIVVQNFLTFADKLGVGPLPVPEPDMAPTTYRGIMPGVYAISGSSKLGAEASDLLKLFTTPEYHAGLAEQMVEPPLDTSVLDDAHVHPVWKKYIELGADNAFVAPSAVARSPEVSKVAAETKPVNPHLGHVVQGYLSGDVTDLRKALRELSGRHTKAREDALAAATEKGAKVDDGAWAFPDWTPREDYGADRYRR